VELLDRHPSRTDRNHLLGIDVSAHRVGPELWRLAHVCARLLPVAEVIDRQLDAVAVGVLVVECGARAVVRREDGFDPQALQSCVGG
jgi:hypothetical protein